MPYPIIALVGPSGSGKTMLIDAVVTALPEQVARIKSIVTRPPRNAEDHLMYDFVTPEEFDALDQAGDVLERLAYAGHWYGVRQSHLHQVLGQGYGIAALIEDGVRYFQKLGYPLIVIRVRPLGDTRPNDPSRSEIDVEREQQILPVDVVIENSFAAGGKAKAISDTLGYIQQRMNYART